MLERMREFSKSWLMKGLLGLVGLSFVAYFGSAPFQKRQKERLLSAVKVNGEIITTQEFLRTYNQMREDQERRQGWPLDNRQQQEVAQSALDILVDQTLEEQWAEQAGLKASDEEVDRRIKAILSRFAQGRPMNQQGYFYLLSQIGYPSVESFENDVRRTIVQEKTAAILAQQVKVTESELRDLYVRLQTQVKVVAVDFIPEDYVDQVEPARQELLQYYDENREQYRNPERVRVDYIEIEPEQLLDEVTIVEARLEQFFRQDPSKYMIEPKAAADYVRFGPERFQPEIVPSEEEIKQYWENHPDQYKLPEQIKVSYIPMAVEDPNGVNAPTIGALQAEYLSSQKEYEQIDTGMIFLRFGDDSAGQGEQKVLEDIRRIRRQIEQGKDFAEAAREYSQDDSAAQGGGIGFVSRGQLPRRLDQALFSLGVGQLSEPIRGTSGYYLLKAHSKHVAPLDEVREKIARQVSVKRLSDVTRDLAGKEEFPERYWRGLSVLSTDFFEAGKSINEEIGSDFHAFSNAAFHLKDGQTSGIVYGRRNLYVIHRDETKPSQRKSLEEVREEIVRAIRSERAPQEARRKAEEASGLIRGGSQTFEEIAARYDLEIKDTGYFTKSDSLPELGPNDYIFVQTAFNLQPNQVSDVVGLESGYYLLRGRPRQEARVPDLEEVRDQVEEDFRKDRAVVLARDRAYEYLRRVEDQNLSLRDLASAEQLETQDSGLFSMDEPVQGIADPTELFHRAAFSITDVGEVLADIVMLSSQGSGEVQGVYLIQLTDRAPSHIPPFAELAKQVTGDVKRLAASDLALEDGRAFVEQLRATYIPSASPMFDLAEFADQQGRESFETPFFRELGYVPGVAGADTSPEFTRTALSLGPGQCSGLITVKEKLSETPAPEGQPLSRLTGYYVLQAKERKEPDFEELDQQREGFMNQLLQARRRQSYRSWLDGLRAAAEIVRNDEFLAGFEGGEAESPEEATEEGQAGPS